MGQKGYRAVLFEFLDAGREFGEYGAGFNDAMKKLWETGKPT